MINQRGVTLVFTAKINYTGYFVGIPEIVTRE